ncbi:alpha/beta hydrolase [Longimycelium tulufanense]|uniref:Alpha/beta hydrolase n=1 Tax=Longimycelium tulufanense TaxID=907463 RepID=A0A8J3FW74_9PSEU|nr:alpha/beta hydrolase [Longimycelium tulufanense]GGM69640.1 alpha/beta hydrolase [Longimycelium tulufanense]
MDTTTYLTGAGGVRLAVRETGPAGAPALVLLHGWAQSGAVWQLSSDEFGVIAADLRGHGASAAPDDGGYRDPRVWADDVAALVRHANAPVVLVGWSYGGLVLTDHLRVHGTAGLAGIVLVGALTELGRGRPGAWVGRTMRAAMPAACDADPAVAGPALAELCAGMSATPLPEEVNRGLLDTALTTPAHVRAGLFQREQDSREVLAAVDVPALVLHGREDTVVDPRAAEYAGATIPGATLRRWDGVGHVPFLERPAEFHRELHGFARRCTAAEVAR